MERRRGLHRIHTSRNHQDLASEAGFPRGEQKLAALFVTQIEVQKDYVDFEAAEQFQRLARRAAMGHHLEIGFRRQQSAQAFPKKDVVI